LAGKVDITQHDQSGRSEPIVTHGPGANWRNWRADRLWLTPTQTGRWKP
jgi:hypothetical protein